MLGVSRRQFCIGASAAGAALGLVACAPSGAAESPRETLTLARFLALVGTGFVVDGNNGAQSLVLSSVRDHGPPIRSPEPSGESFTLVLRPSAPAPTFDQGAYTTRHAVLGTFSMFMVSRLEKGTGVPLYTATFSRI